MRTRSWTLAVVLFDEVELLDVAGPLQVFSTAGRHWNWRPFKAFTVAEKAGSITTRGQLAIRAEQSFDACRAAELLLVPGGYGARRALEHRGTLEFVARVGGAADLVLAVGNGSLLLAKAGLTRNAELSVPGEALETLAALDPSARGSSDAALLASGKLLSTKSSGRAPALALAAVSRMLGAKQAAQTASTLGLDSEDQSRIEVVTGPPKSS